MRKQKGNYGRQVSGPDFVAAADRKGKEPVLDRPVPAAPVKTGRPIRPEDIPGYQGATKREE